MVNVTLTTLEKMIVFRIADNGPGVSGQKLSLDL